MTDNDIQDFIKNNTAILLYFFNDNCAPCKILRPKVQDMIEADFPKIQFKLINAEQYAATAVQYDVFSSPTLLIFFEGKEYIRESKNISISELHDKTERIYRMIF